MDKQSNIVEKDVKKASFSASLPEVFSREIEIGGKTLKVEIGKLANQATGSVTVQYGDTIVLATVVLSQSIRPGISYFPLMVDFEERMYAAGKIKGSRFVKREGRPSDDAVLSARLIDRTLRPLFPEEIRNDIQVVVTVLSIDDDNDPDVIGLIAASIALSISNIPFNGPIAALRVGQINDEWVINPSYTAREKSVLDLVVAGTAQKAIMIEASALEVSEAAVLEAIKFAQKHFRKINDFIAEIQKEKGAEKLKVEDIVAFSEEDESANDSKQVLEKTRKFLAENAEKFIFNSPKATKAERKKLSDELKESLDSYLVEQKIGKEKRDIALKEVGPFLEAEVTKAILERKLRVDNRSLTKIRSLQIEAGLLPRTHGSGLFSRGETQVLSVVTLGAPGDVQFLDTMEVEGKKRYIHHYNFPPYSVGEVQPMRGPGRREVGHGALAEKALMPVLPDKETFPYTIHVVSEVLSSNGSSSMASTCGSTLALMDAGVPIKKPVAGIAMGMASDSKDNFKILTDLQDLEDGKGGMDFKIAGTCDGITAIQMDTKTQGLTLEIIEKTLAQGLEARLKILTEIKKVIPEPRKELSPYAPRIFTLRVDPEKIGLIIGPQGKTINQIIDETGVDIDIEDDGIVMITSENEKSADQAIKQIKDLTREIKVGDVIEGKVSRVLDFGAMVELAPKQDGLVHISNLSDQHIACVEDAVKLGDMLKVKVVEIDAQGRVNLCVEGVKHCQISSQRPRNSFQQNRGRRSGPGGYSPAHGRPGFAGRKPYTPRRGQF